jgi:hypothetical protein
MAWGQVRIPYFLKHVDSHIYEKEVLAEGLLGGLSLSWIRCFRHFSR